MINDNTHTKYEWHEFTIDSFWLHFPVRTVFDLFIVP